jgi:hypothetical protein
VRVLIALFLLSAPVHADVIEQAREGWDDMVHVGLEKLLGYSFSAGDFQGMDAGKAQADGACNDAEKALSNGKDHEASLKLNNCRQLAIKLALQRRPGAGHGLAR